MQRYKDFAIVVPCYNEEQAIGEVLAQLIRLQPAHIIVVDDASQDSSASIVKLFPKVKLLTNKQNRGSGFSLMRGLKYASMLKVKYILTIDADGQHRLSDAVRVMEKMLQTDSLIVSGERQFDRYIPLSKKITNALVRYVFVLLYGFSNPDPACGLRAYSAEVVPLLNFSPGFDWIVNLNQVIQRNAKRCTAVDISATYSDYSLRKGQNLRSGTGLFIKLVSNKLTGIAKAFRLWMFKYLQMLSR